MKNKLLRLAMKRNKLRFRGGGADVEEVEFNWIWCALHMKGGITALETRSLAGNSFFR